MYIITHVLIKDNIYSLNTTLTSFLSMIYHWNKVHQKDVDVIADNSKQFDAQKDMIHKLSSIKEGIILGYDTRKHKYPIPLHSFATVDSETSFGVQIADMVASAVAFRWNETTPKYQIFQEEISGMEFFSIPCYPIQPARAKELSQPVDDSEDTDPFEYLEHHLL